MFDFRLPGRHDDLRRHAQVRLQREGHVDPDVPRQGAAQRSVLLHDRLVGRQVRLAGHRRLASSGLLAATWASLVSLGREGYLRYAKQIFETAYAMQDAVRAHPELRIIGDRRRSASRSPPTSSTSITSTTRCGSVAGGSTVSSIRTRSTWPSPARRRRRACWTPGQHDIPEAVAYANEHRDEPAQSSSIYGGAVTPTSEITAKINSVDHDLLDTYQSLPPAI